MVTLTVPLAEVEPWPDLNPRFDFDRDAIQGLADSIKDVGLLQPVLVAPAGLQTKGIKYWLFAGERRFRACQILDTHRERLKTVERQTIDVIVRDVDEATAHRLAGAENLDRNDLTAIEEGVWLARELELTGSSQRELGRVLGRSQAWIANRIRLLDLPKGVRTLIHDGTIAPAMARDHLLRFLKVSPKAKSAGQRILPAIAARIKKAAAKNGAVEREAMVECIWKAMQASGAEVIEADWVRIPGPGWKQVKITAEALKRFKATLGEGMCVQAPTQYGGEETYTFDSKAWRTFLKEEQKLEAERLKQKQDETPEYADVIARAKLGPDKKPRSMSVLEGRFGWENVYAMADLGDIEGIRPDQVIPGLVDRGTWGKDGRVDDTRIELVYVGTDGRKREQAKRGAQGEEVIKSEARAMRRAIKAAEGTHATLALRGLVDVLLRSYDLANTTVRLLRAMGRDVPHKWTHHPYSGSLDQVEPPLTANEVHQLAGAAAAVCYDPTEDNAYAARQKRSDAATARVTKQRAKALEAWTAEHAPSFKGEEAK